MRKSEKTVGVDRWIAFEEDEADVIACAASKQALIQQLNQIQKDDGQTFEIYRFNKAVMWVQSESRWK